MPSRKKRKNMSMCLPVQRRTCCLSSSRRVFLFPRTFNRPFWAYGGTAPANRFDTSVRGTGGVALFVNKDIGVKACLLSDPSVRNFLHAVVGNPSPTHVVVVYRPPRLNDEDGDQHKEAWRKQAAELEKIAQVCAIANERLLVLGDFNFASAATSDVPVQEQLDDLQAHGGLQSALHQVLEHPITRRSGSLASCPDDILHTHNAIQALSLVEGIAPVGCDHVPIAFSTVAASIPDGGDRRPRASLYGIDHEAAHDFLLARFDNFDAYSNNHTPNENLRFLKNLIEECTHACPAVDPQQQRLLVQKRPPADKSSVPFGCHVVRRKWWELGRTSVPDFSAAFYAMKKAKKRYLHAKSTDKAKLHEEAKDAEAKFKKLAFEAQQLHQQRTAEDLVAENGIGVDWRQWKDLQQHSFPCLASVVCHADDLPPVTAQDGINNMAAHFEQQCKPNQDDRWASSPAIVAFHAHCEERCDVDEPNAGSIPAGFSDHVSSACNNDFSMADIHAAMARVAMNATPGVDGMDGQFLCKFGREALLPFLLSLANSTWRTGQLPDEWKHSLVVPIYKGKGEMRLAENYRPISLTCTCCKICEYMLLERLSAFFCTTKAAFEAALAPEQTGFRTGHNTFDNLLRVTQRILECLAAREPCVGFFFDVAHAFDSAWIAGILERLRAIGVHGRLLRWIRSFLTGRKAEVVQQGYRSRLFHLLAGTPQGSVLSPLLFAIFINELFPELKLFDALAAGFADDLASISRPLLNPANLPKMRDPLPRNAPSAWRGG